MPEIVERSIEDGEVTRAFLDNCWETWPDHQTARFLDTRMRKLESQSRRNFIEAGIIALEVSDRCLWKEMFDPETGECFSSFDNWIQNAASVSRSSVYESMRVLKALPDLDVNTMKEIPRSNLKTLTALSSKIGHDESVIEAARTQSDAKFRKTLQERHPDQQIESMDGIFFPLTKTQRKLVEDVLAVVTEQNECSSKSEALEALCTDFFNTKGWTEK